MTPSEYKGTAPQEAQADPKQNWCWCEHGTCEVCAPVPQTEGEDKAAQLKRNLIAMGYTDDQAQEIATRLALKGGHA